MHDAHHYFSRWTRIQQALKGTWLNMVAYGKLFVWFFFRNLLYGIKCCPIALL